MNRRRFLFGIGIGGVVLLSGCGRDRGDPAVLYPPREMWMDPGPLRSVYTDVDGLRMHALVAPAPRPDASPLVLVHGSGLSGQYMIPVARELAGDFQVSVPDIPGYGDSANPPSILGVPEMADWLVAWMDAVGHQQVAMLGNSFGCQVVADLAARHPTRVSHAVLQGPTTPPAERSAFWQFVRWRQNQVHNPDWLGDVTGEDYEKAGFWRLVRSFMHQISDRIEDKMPRIEAQVLVVRGALDPIVHQSFCEWLVDLAPRGSLHVIPEASHTLVFTAPVSLAEATRRFVLEDAANGGEGGR